jgi:aryl-alcohol dehydrogenase-like predicted oxidoreductase
MLSHRLGQTELNITPIGLGTWAMGGAGWEFAWGPQSDQESIRTIHRALDLGINWIDTAAVYGLGHAEEIIGRALKGRPERPYLFTKGTMVWDKDGTIGHSLQPASIRRELEASLRRLQIDAIDLYHIHWLDSELPIEEAWSTLVDLKKEGKIRYIGVSNFTVEEMARTQLIAPVDSLQVPYSIIKPEVESTILPYCRLKGIGVLAYSPTMAGLLTGTMTRERIAHLPEDDWRRWHPEFQEPRLPHNLQVAEKLRDIGQQHEASPAEVAIAWTLRHPAVHGAAVGARRPDQVDGFIGASQVRLSEAEAAEISAHADKQSWVDGLTLSVSFL